MCCGGGIKAAGAYRSRRGIRKERSSLANKVVTPLVGEDVPLHLKGLKHVRAKGAFFGHPFEKTQPIKEVEVAIPVVEISDEQKTDKQESLSLLDEDFDPVLLDDES